MNLTGFGSFRLVAIAGSFALVGCGTPSIESKSYDSFLLFFERDSALISEPEPVLDQAAKQAIGEPFSSLEILAFRARDESRALDDSRGKAVSTALVSRGVPENKIRLVLRDDDVEIKIGDQVVIDGSRRVEIKIFP